MNDRSDNIVELVDENNDILSFEHIMTLDYADREYVVLAPLEAGADSNEEDEVVILRVEHDDNGDDYYMNIEDEDELEEVFAAVTEVLDEETH